ncbi:4-coumarate-CoA ligase [Tothia fuscella]|uniref:4-coumarate-CoA ligase n=1 Tax=Tothia fuscella TaxID=1048955 RepID=A0A9P4NGG4_9PEZI|nr:4-coumarate-CoA ligase [Tothia fuscella]
MAPRWQRFIHPNAPDIHSPYIAHDKPIFASPFGPFPPIAKDLNVHEFCSPPDQNLLEDYDLFIDAVTDERVTLHHFLNRVRSLARVLRYDGPGSLGLKKSPKNDTEAGEILGLFSRNNVHYPMLVHACFRAELVFGGISPESTPFELWHVLRKMQITSLVCHETLLPVVVEALKLGRGPEGELQLVLDLEKIIILSEDLSLNTVLIHRTVESLVREGSKLAEPHRKLLGGDKLCYLFQSSGTSGLPKAMMISHKNAIHSGMQGLITATQTARFLEIETLTHQTVLGIIPAYHSYGMILWVLRLGNQPSTNIMMPKWDLELALRTIEKYKVTLLPLVPPLVRQLALSPLTEKYDLSSVQAVASGAAYLPPDVAYELAKKLPNKAPIPSGYGLSEAASIAAPPMEGLFGLKVSEPGTIGFLLPGMEGRVVDPDNLKDVPKGTKGELWVRGEVVCMGYFHDEKATAEIFTEPGWLRTGDLVMRDAEDRIHYHDRLKEMIKVKGLQVAATEVEDTLLDHPEKLVIDACVAGVDNGRGDGSLFVRAWVVPSANGKEQGEEVVIAKLNTWVGSRLSKHKHLTGGIEVVEAIPRTPSGKMLRREMRDLYHKGVRAGQIKAKL